MPKPTSPASPRDVLTPDALAMLQAVAASGSFAAAARALNLVPSAVTYRVRQMEDALDVLLFDRSSRQAQLTAAGAELLRDGERLLFEIDAIANRVKRVAGGWESQLTIAVDGVLSMATVMELVDAFLRLAPATRLRLRDETLSGTLEALLSGQADLALGVAFDGATSPGVACKPIGDLPFVYTVAPHHPLAALPEPLTDDLLQRHRAIAVADTTLRGSGVTLGLLAGPQVLTVPTMHAKLDAQLRGLGGGFVPEPMARPFIESGRLVQKAVDRPPRVARLGYAWRGGASGGRVAGKNGQLTMPGRALQWWLAQLDSPATRRALLEQHRMPQ